MTCILARGFEHGSIYDFDYISLTASATVSATYKRPGGISNYGAYLRSAAVGRLTLPAAKSEFYFQSVLSFNSKSAAGHFIKWKKGSTVLGSLYFDYTLNLFKLYTGDVGSLVATGTLSPAQDAWYIIELYIKIADAGVLTCRINGIQDMTFSGDTKPGADTDVDNIDFTSGSVLTFYVDDLIINDTTGSAPGNSWPSGANVSGIVPSGAGATTQWTPSTGSNYACVDEIPPVGTDYVSINAVDQIDSYAMGDLPAAAAIVLGVEETIFASRMSLPTPTTLKPLLRHSGTDYPESSGQTVPLTSATPLRKCWGQNPGTGPADWTVANVNALEIGFKSAA